MKLLFLNHNTAGVGTYVRAFRFGQVLAQRGHEVTLVTTRPRGVAGWHERVTDGVRVLEAPDLWRGPARTGWDPYNTARRWLRLRAETFDVIQAWDSRPAVVVPALAIADSLGAPIVMDWCDWWGRGGRIEERSGWLVRTLFGPVETFFEEHFRDRAEQSTVISTALRARLEGLGYPSERITLLPNGCEQPGAPTTVAEARAELRRLGRLTDTESPLLAHLGVVLPDDLDLMVEAVHNVRRDRPGTRLVMIGNPKCRLPTAPIREGWLVPTGFVPDAERDLWLAAADACVIPMLDTVGHRGRMPAKVGDYMTAGRPIVITRVGDMAALVERGRLGQVTAPNPEAFAGGIETVLSDEPAAIEAGTRGRLMAAGELSWASMTDRLEAVYGRVAPGSGQIP